MTEMHIASLLVQGQPSALDKISHKIEALEGAEIHARDPVGKILVTIESESEAKILSRLNLIQAMDSVISAALVYHEVDFSD